MESNFLNSKPEFNRVFYGGCGSRKINSQYIKFYIGALHIYFGNDLLRD